MMSSSEQNSTAAATVTMDLKILLVILILQSIPNAANGFDIATVLPQLLAQSADVHIHRAGLYRVIRIPDGLQQLLPAEGHAGVTEEQPQKLVFLVAGNAEANRGPFDLAEAESELPQVRVTRLEGTYLIWLDILPFELSSDEA